MKYFLLITFLLPFQTTSAQENIFVPKSNKIQFLGLNTVNIVGYSGNEIIIESKSYTAAKQNDRCAGLKLVGSDSFDNIDLGLAVKNSNDGVVISQVGTTTCGEEAHNYKIKVPSSMNVEFINSSWDGKTVMITNVGGEIEISTNYNDIFLSEVTGPLAVKTVYGSIEAIFSEVSQKGSISLYSVYEYVDVSLPENSHSNINFKTQAGNIYTDLNIEVEKSGSNNKWSGDKILGDLNGGGVDINLTSSYDNIYFRKSN